MYDVSAQRYFAFTVDLWANASAAACPRGTIRSEASVAAPKRADTRQVWANRLNEHEMSDMLLSNRVYRHATFFECAASGKSHE